MSGDNPKSELVDFLQRYISRTLTRDDVVYSTEELEGQHLSTIRLVCLEGQEFRGELCATEKLATQSAAAQAIAAFAAEIASLPPRISARAKAKAQKSQQATVATPGAAADPVAVAPTANFKTELVQQLQAHCKRAMTKADILYELAGIGSEFQATVRLVCVGGLEFSGEVSSGEKLAEHAAAEQALLHAHTWPPGQAAKTVAAKQQTSDSKSELVLLLQRRLGRALAKGDLVYATSQIAAGAMQATVTLTCLQGRKFAGEVCTSQKLAEVAAARQAAQVLCVESGAAALPPAKRQKGPNGASLAGGLAVTGKGCAPTGGSITGKGALGKVVQEPREMVVLSAITGEVIQWNDGAGWGWLRPHSVVSHPLAQQRGGKIYVHKKDMASGLSLAVGTLVQFCIYADPKGLGACDVMAF